MNNLFKTIFGFPPDDNWGPSMGDDKSSNWGSFKNDSGADEEEDGDDNYGDDRDNMRMHPGGGGGGGGIGFIGFPLFSDPIEIHKHFERLIDEMHRKFEVFGFHNGASITWKDEQGGIFSPTLNEEQGNTPESLRDSFLKSPGCSRNNGFKKEDIDLGSEIKAEDVDSIVRSGPGPSGNRGQELGSQVFSKSVFIRTVRRPDGSVETVKKIRDHTGKEETTTTIVQGDPPQNLPENQLTEPDDASGISIFRKFFPF